MKERLYEKLAREAQKMKNMGKFESAKNIGRIKDDYYRNAIKLSYKAGLFKRGFEISQKRGFPDFKYMFLSKVTGVGRKGKYINNNLCEKFEKNIDPDNQRKDQNPEAIYFQN